MPLPGACGRGCGPVPQILVWERGLSERSEFRSPRNRDRGTGTRRATPGREWFWVLLPKQKDLVVRGRNPACKDKDTGSSIKNVEDDRRGSRVTTATPPHPAPFDRLRAGSLPPGERVLEGGLGLFTRSGRQDEIGFEYFVGCR